MKKLCLFFLLLFLTITITRITPKTDAPPNKSTGREVIKNSLKHDLNSLLKKIEKDPTNVHIVFSLGKTYFLLKDMKNARTWFARRTAMQGPAEELAYAYYRLGDIYEKAGNFKDALFHYFASYSVYPFRAEPLVKLGKYYLIAKEEDLSYSFAHRAVEIPFPENNNFNIEKNVYYFDRYKLLGQISWRVGKYDEGRAAILQALKVKPDDVFLLHLLTHYCSLCGDPVEKELIAVYQNALSKSQEFVCIPKEDMLWLYQIMKDVHEVFEYKNFLYWIDSGTLLGAVRHKGIIPWDDDLDICIREEDVKKFETLIPLFNALDYAVKPWFFGFKIFPNSGKKQKEGCNYPFLDVVVTHEQNGRWYYKNFPNYYRDGDKFFMKNDELFPLRKYAFGKFFVYGPQNPTEQLLSMYGKRYLDLGVQTWTHQGILMHTQKQLTDFDRVPAAPTGPLKDRVAELIQVKFRR